MDPRKSPYAPGAGTRPPALAGRERELERFSILLDRLADGRSGEALLYAGSRGMGKTVLLRECERRARSAGWFTAFEEVHRDLALRELMALCARDVLLEMSASKRFEDRIRRALGVLKAFTSVGAFGVTVTIDADALAGTADSGVLQRDLRALFREIGELAQSEGAGVVFLLDELHGLQGTDEMAGLDAVIHGMAQEQLPVTAVGAGVFAGPGFRDPGDVVGPSSYAGRLYRVVRLRALEAEAAARALVEPARDAGVAFDDAAIAQAVDFAEGSPYVLQLLGEEAWAGAEGPRIGSGDVRSAISRVTERLDGEFYPRLVYEVGPSGIAVIAAFARAPQAAVSAAELAAASDQPLHEVHRILRALERRDLVHRAHVAGDRHPGYALATRGLGAYVERAGLVEAATRPPAPPGG